MIGALMGDIVGSRYEFDNIKTKEFPLFHPDCFPTDDSVMSLAVADALLTYLDSGKKENLASLAIEKMQSWGHRYPNAGYGGRFYGWLLDENPQPYHSLGNGSAMRVSPCAYAADSLEEALFYAEEVTKVTHNHPEGLKGAFATTACIWFARQGESKAFLRNYVEAHYYPLDFTYEEIYPDYEFDVTCMGSVPQAILCFLESTDYEDCIRNCIALGGDCDTTAAIAGAIAEAYYGIPEDLYKQGIRFLAKDQKTLLEAFEDRFPHKVADGCTIRKLDPSELADFSKVIFPMVVNYYIPIDGVEKATYMGQKNQTPEAIRTHLAEGYRYYYAERDGKVIGYIAFYPEDEKMYLSKFYVDEAYRGEGIGKCMFQFVCDAAKQEHLKGVFLNVNKLNEASLRIYESLGMHVARTERIDIGGGHFKDDYVYEILF